MRILVADDDRKLGSELSSFLSLQGHEVQALASLAEARKTLEAAERFDLILADLYLGPDKGTELLPAAGATPVVMISGAGGVREAVEALKAGAWDFLEKPIDPDRLLGILRNLERGLEAERGLAALRDAWLAEHAAFAPGSAFGAALEEARRVAPSPLAVLIGGPSGSGKEVVARWIHYCSPRSAGPFVAVNCAAVPPELAESAFFGAVKGAYTGAETDRPGWFQAADGGTLFLDEVGDIPSAVQAKLLRAVEYGEAQRLGSTRTERVSVRLVAASNRDLQAAIAAGSFREDLYWRLAQALIRVPGLEERRADIPALACFFLERARGGFGRVEAGGPGLVADGPGDSLECRFDEEALRWLAAREWPGNVRELRAFIDRAAWLARGPRIGAAELAEIDALARGSRPGTKPAEPRPDQTGLPAATAEEGPTLPLKEAKEDFERRYVERVLRQAGSVAKAAALLGLLPNNLSRKLRELGISAPANR